MAALDPELEAARKAGLIPDPLAVGFAAFGGPAPPSPQLLSIADQTHAAPAATPTIAPAPPAMDTPRLTARSAPSPAAVAAAAPAAGGAETLPMPAGVPSQADAKAAMDAAIRVGPDSKSSGVSKASQAAIRAKSIELGRATDKEKAIAKDEAELEGDKARDIVDDETQKRLDREFELANQAMDKAELDAAHVAAKDEAKRLRGDLAKDYERGFFETQGTAKTWLGAISIGLGAFAANWNKTPNFAWNIMERAMDDHASREKGRLLRKKEEIERQGGDVKETLAAIRDYDTITKPQREAALLQRAVERRTALLAKYGAGEAQIKGDRLIQKADEERIVREMAVEQGLATRVESDNSEQQKMRRAAALATGPGGGGTDKEDAKLSEGERKAQVVINGSLTATKEASKHQYAPKDVKALTEMVAASRNVDPSDPVKFWAALTQIKGKHYSQMSPGGQKRFNAFFRGAQDLERITSGGAIGTHEIVDFLARSTEPGSEGVLIQRARDMLPATGQPNKVAMRIDAAAAEMGMGRGGGTPAGGGQPRAAANPAGTRAAAIEGLRAPGLSAKDRAALDWARANPGDPRAAQVIETARGKAAN